MKSAIAVLGIAFLFFVGAAVVSFSGSASDQGREVYAMQKCALCHSISGVGGKKLALDGVGSKLKSDEIKKWIRTPKAMKADSTMKAYPNLPEKDLNDLTDYLLTLK